LVEKTIQGFKSAPPAERAMLGILSSFSVSIGAARAINYVREQRRPGGLALRDWVRRVYHAPGEDKPRIHHFLPGMSLAFIAAAAAITKRDDDLGFWLGLVFGTGSGLTLDEVALLTEMDNPYWDSERVAAAQAGLAAVGAGGLLVRFFLSGSRGTTGG
jgi:hypothetical protein